MLLRDGFKTKKWDFIWSVAVVALILIASYIRYALLDTHFSHCDDLIAAHNLPSEKAESLSSLFDYARRVSNSSTYAPLQFILTGAITDRGMSYQNILFWSRVPSFLMTLISFGVILFISKKLYKQEFLIYSILPIFIIGFSWEDIIYSVQSESYTIGLLAVLILFLLLFSLLKKEKISIQTSITTGLIIGTLIYSNYQFLFFLPGFFLALLSKYSEGKFSLKIIELRNQPLSKTLNKITKVIIQFTKDFYPSLIIITAAFIIIFKLFLQNIAGRGLNWNTGVNDEFRFNSVPTDSFLDRIGYLMAFFIENTLIVFNSIISIAQETNPLNDIYVILSFLLFIIGFRSFYKSQQDSKKYFSYFFIITMALWVILTLVQKITLSPTRHSLVLLSFVLIFVPEGIYSIFQKLKAKEHIKKITIGIFVLFSLLTFSTSYTTITEERLDKFKPGKIESIIKNNNVSEIYTYGFTWNFKFMKYINSNFSLKHSTGELFYKHKDKTKGNILLITHRDRKLDDYLIEEFLGDSNRDSTQSFKILFQEEMSSETEIDFSNKTKNGANSMLYYILEPNSNN